MTTGFTRNHLREQHIRLSADIDAAMSRLDGLMSDYSKICTAMNSIGAHTDLSSIEPLMWCGLHRWLSSIGAAPSVAGRGRLLERAATARVASLGVGNTDDA